MSNLPEGVIYPYKWGKESIPFTGRGSVDSVTDSVTSAMRLHGIVGCAVCHVKRSEIVASQEFGYAELQDLPFATTTSTRCGSLAKPVTALCALLVADAGLLDIDAPILPVLRGIGIEPRPLSLSVADDRRANITVGHLMDHTSGLPRSAACTAWRPERNIAVLKQLNHIASAAVSGKPFNTSLTCNAMPLFGVFPEEIYVFRNQKSVRNEERCTGESAYFQTSAERYVSYIPEGAGHGQTLGEAYKGYGTEAADGAGGIACTAEAIGRIVANLHSESPAISRWALDQILTPPAHCSTVPDFKTALSNYYSKGFMVTPHRDGFMLGHGGMTNHCGGVIGHYEEYQFVAVSNWDNHESPYVDVILKEALTSALQQPSTA